MQNSWIKSTVDKMHLRENTKVTKFCSPLLSSVLPCNGGLDYQSLGCYVNSGIKILIKILRFLIQETAEGKKKTQNRKEHLP